MLKYIKLKENKKFISQVDNGTLIFEKKGKFYAFYILHLDAKGYLVEKEYLDSLDLNASDLESLNIKKDGLYTLDTDDLKIIQKIEPKLLLEKYNHSNYGKVYFLMDEGMLVIGTQKIINNIPHIIALNELDVYRNSVYEFIEATFPDDIEAERQFSYKVPSFFEKIFEKKLNYSLSSD